MMLSLQNSINSRNGPGGNKNRSVWLRVGVTGVAFQAVNTVIVITEKKLQLNITQAVEELGWEENEDELAMKIHFNMYNALYNKERLSSLVKINSAGILHPGNIEVDVPTVEQWRIS